MTPSNIIDILLLLCVICNMIQITNLRRENSRLWKVLIGLRSSIHNNKTEIKSLNDDVNTILVHMSFNGPEKEEDEKAD